MAFDNVEVEIKLAVTPEKFQEVRRILQSTAILKGSSAEEDEYFTPAHRNFVAPEHPFEWLRIRKKAGKNSINYKHFHPENSSITTHCDEFETQIERPEKLRGILTFLDIAPLIIVRKTRETFVTSDFEIALDEVDELGHFVEIECLKDLGGVVASRERIYDFCRSLSLDPTTETQKGYPHLLLEKKGLLKP